MTKQTEQLNMIPCDCPKGGEYEGDDGNFYLCPKCNGTEWIEKLIRKSKTTEWEDETIIQGSPKELKQFIKDLLKAQKQEIRTELKKYKCGKHKRLMEKLK